MNRFLHVLSLLLVVGALALSAPVRAQAPPATPPIETRIGEEAEIRVLVQSMDEAEKAVADASEHDDELGRLRGEVERILSESTRLAEALRPRLSDVKSQIERLGPAPARDAPPEAPGIAAERTRLGALAAALDGAIKTTELTWVRARQLIERIIDLRHALFSKNLMQRRPSPLLPDLWRNLARDAPAFSSRLGYLASDWWSWARMRLAGVSALLVISILLFVALRHVLWGLTESRRRRERSVPPTFFERAASISWVAPVRAVAPIFAALLLYGGLDAMDLLYFPSDRLMASALKAVIIFAAVAAIITAVLAPENPDWRLVPLNSASAWRVSILLQGITAVFAIDLALDEVNKWLLVPLSISVVQTLTANLAIAGMLIALVLTPFTAEEPGARVVSRHFPRALKVPLWLVALAMIGASLTGYVALGRFIGQQFVVTAVALVVAGLLYLAIRALTREPAESGLPVGPILEARFGLDAPRRQTLARLTEFVLTLTLLMMVIPFILLQWGFAAADVGEWMRSFFFGFEIGQFRISLARILLGIVVFIALLLVTRLVQRWLREAVLVPARMDAGIANSIETVAGYAGTALAVLLAISFAGFDVTNLAIVAGALSVGIGFGLQGIVNNFVSGLVLLVERPVKVGDWIVVGSDEGYVRKISVRSTEIETFDRSSVIIPNAELISGRVKNWTLRDAVGRLKITVNVRFAADPDKARQIMLELAGAHPSVLKFPAPFVTFDAFGSDTATLSLNVFVTDVTKGNSIRTDLSFIVLQRLQGAGMAAAIAPPPPLKVPILVAPDADPERARQIMLACAARHPDVLPSPAAFVTFEGLNGDGLAMSLNVFVSDPLKSDAIKAELAFAVLNDLRASGVGGPASHQHVHLADLEPLRRAIAAVMEERRREREAGQ